MVDIVFILDHNIHYGNADSDVCVHDRCNCLFYSIGYNKGKMFLDLKAFCGSRGWCIFVIRDSASEIINFLNRLYNNATTVILDKLLHEDFRYIKMIKHVIDGWKSR